MKKKRPFLFGRLTGFLGIACLAVFALSGCVTAKGAEPYADVDGRSLLIPDEGLYVAYDDHSGSRVNYIIPAGKHKIEVLEYRKIYPAGNSYVRFTETWNCEYEFLPGKSYKVTVEKASPSYNGGLLTVGEPDITLSGPPSNVSVNHAAGTGIEIYEYTSGPGKMVGRNTYLGFYSAPNIFLGWLYGPNFVSLGIAPKLGLQIMGGKFGANLIGDAGGAFGFSFPNGDFLGGPRLGLFYHYGGLVEFYTASIGFAAGGGIANAGIFFYEGYGNQDGDFFTTYSLPYVEFDILFSRDIFASREEKTLEAEGRKIYFQFYFNNSEMMIDKFGIGIKLN
ncbi:MAG: hypothetical protein LBF83_01585 [Spirochaetaceae bacterium]|jgi:hypothetical protein|nr:hypothetical protein [Spirochaetaceae bacterium]